MTHRAPGVHSGQPQAQPCLAHRSRHPAPQSWHPPRGGIYFERKVAEGKTKKEALRSLKRHVSNAAYRQLLLDAQWGSGRTLGNDS
jgi:hypothetical protein